MGGEFAVRERMDGMARSVRSPSSRADADAEDDEASSPGSGTKGAPLPEIDTLVARLPVEVRETLNELFRVQFASVKKIPKKALQSATRKTPPTPPPGSPANAA
jgi:hypothetical protein